MLRLTPSRLLLTATIGFLFTTPVLAALAVPLPLGLVALLGFVAGMGGETFGVMWDTSMQQEIPDHKLSRVVLLRRSRLARPDAARIRDRRTAREHTRNERDTLGRVHREHRGHARGARRRRRPPTAAAKPSRCGGRCLELVSE